MGQLGLKNLEGDGAVVLEILGQKDGGHPSAAELALEPVAAGEGVLESRE